MASTGAEATDPIPLVYSCSGCSSAAQAANTIAVELDRRGVAEMSCIAGVGGDVPSLVRVATSGRPIVAIDGCRLRCVAACLRRHDVEADLHVDLATHGVKKRKHTDADPRQARQLTDDLAERIAAGEHVASRSGARGGSDQGAGNGGQGQ